MINKQHRDDHQCLKLAFIEACISEYGFYQNKMMSQVFGNHEKDAARISARYKRENPEALDRQSRSLVPSVTYKRKFLKRYADANRYIHLLEELHGSELECE